MSDRKPTDDVQQLLKGKHLGDLHYREFTAPQAAHLTLAGSKLAAPEANLPANSAAAARELPQAALPAQPAPPRSGPVAGLPSAPIAGLPPAPAPTISRAAVHESPLNFTFERLRRQVIPARASGPLVDLKLTPRLRAVMPSRFELLQQRVMTEVFNTLVHAPGARRLGS